MLSRIDGHFAKVTHMLNSNVRHSVGRWLAVLVLLLGCGLALAQSEPSMNQIFEAARAGRLDQAQSMMQQVLTAHPNSAKAHFVNAELLAQQGRIDAARTSLATAERLAPGLPFASAEAKSGLRARLSGSGLNGLTGVTPRTPGAPSSAAAPARAAPSAPAASGMSVGGLWPVLLIGGGIALFLMLRRRSAAARQGYPGGAYASGYGNAPVNPGAPGVPQPYAQPGQPAGQPYAQPGQPYAQPQPYGQQPAASGMGSRIAGGLATGAAIGVGMMAAQAIGRSITGQNSAPSHSGIVWYGNPKNDDAGLPGRHSQLHRGRVKFA